jgi:hypothetical protein
MRTFNLFAISLCAVVLCAMTATRAKAGPFDEKTTVTFTDPVEIPGQVLEPGTYVFKLVDSPFDRNLVQVWTGAEDRLLATINTTSDYQLEPSNKSTFVMDRPSDNSPAELESWFYAGRTIGQRFIYPQNDGENQEAANIDSAH